MGHPVIEVIGSSASLARGGTFGPSEGIHQRGDVPGPSRGLICIDMFHIYLFSILVEAVAFS